MPYFAHFHLREQLRARVQHQTCTINPISTQNQRHMQENVVRLTSDEPQKQLS